MVLLLFRFKGGAALKAKGGFRAALRAALGAAFGAALRVALRAATGAVHSAARRKIAWVQTLILDFKETENHKHEQMPGMFAE